MSLMSFIFIFIIILFKFTKSNDLKQCEKSSPFLIIKDNQCTQTCTREELKSGICVITEPNVKKQYLSNLIILGSPNYRYININSNKNGDLVILTTKSPGTGERLFYGLKENGRFLFKNENSNEYPYLLFNISGEQTEDQQKFESESLFIQLSNSDESKDKNEFYLSMAKNDQYTEMFDFENESEYNFKKTIDFFGKEIYSDRWTILRLVKEEDDTEKYNYLFAAINKEKDENKYILYLKKIYFNSKFLSQIENSEESEEIKCQENKMVSCFQTDNGRIVCFYRGKKENNEELAYYTISSYKCCFSNDKSIQIERSESSLTFYKGIHLKGDVGFFIYFLDAVLSRPYITFKYIKSDGTIEDYNSIQTIHADFFTIFRYDYNLNDIIKISNTSVFYVSVAENREKLFYVNITLLSDDKKVNMKYYEQLIREQNKYSIFKDIRLSLYKNQFITVGASICPISSDCFNDGSGQYSSFFIYSYPNSSDVNFSLTEKLYESNKEITDINFNLAKYTIIENNLFGYIVKGIKIINFPENIKLISVKTNLEINRGEILSEDENFTISFPSNNNYVTNKYTIEYALVATEDKWDIVSVLCLKFDTQFGNQEEEIAAYGGGTYIGRTSHFNIIIDMELDTDCEDFCSLCLLNNKSHCIICKDEYYFEGNEKICKRNKNATTDLLDITPTDNITQFNSSFITTFNSFEISSNTYFTTSLKLGFLSTQIKSTEPIFSSSITSVPISLNNFLNTSYISNSILASSSIKSSHISSLSIPSSSLSSSSVSSSSPLSTSFLSSSSPHYIPSSLTNTQKTSSVSSSFISHYSINNFSTKITSTHAKSYSSIISNIIIKSDCSKEEILENKCKEGTITNEQIEDIYNDMKNEIINKEYKNENKIIETQNAKFQVSLSEEQKSQNKRNISSIDLGECEKIIKKKVEGLKEDDELIVLKTDIRDDSMKSTFVQFEIFHPYTLEKIDLDICNNVDININVPVYFEEKTQKLSQRMNESGYNIFDVGDRFYNDICSKFTTDSGTDIILKDRRNDIYSLTNITLCQKGCNFKYYNYKLNKANCKCQIVEKTSFISDFNDIKIYFGSKNNLFNLFHKSLSLSNIVVMKCYKLAFDSTDIMHNYGCIIMTILFLFIIICMLKYFIKDNEKINYYFKSIFNQNYFSSHTINNTCSNIKKIKEQKPKIISNAEKSNKVKEKNKYIIHKKTKKLIDNKSAPPKKNKENNILKSERNKKKNDDSQSSKRILKAKSLIINNLFFNKNSNTEMSASGDNLKLKASGENIKYKNNKIKSKKSFNIKNLKCKKSIFKNLNKNINNKILKSKNTLNKKILKSTNINIFNKKDLKRKKTCNNKIMKNLLLNDYEINTLNYKDALKLDKRTYFEYYFSLLKKKHIILFAFFPNNDYNIVSIKISLFILSLSWYLTINALFFTDDSMHNIYSNNGEFIIYNQLPKIFCSAFISLTLQKILKLLCISEYDILKIKREKKLVIATKKSQDIKKCLYIKFLIFFILSFCCMALFWYFMTCFCAVYTNTQIILFKNILLSYGISMIYPFIINLIPGIFRINALKASKKDKEFAYKIGNFVAII